MSLQVIAWIAVISGSVVVVYALVFLSKFRSSRDHSSIAWGGGTIEAPAGVSIGLLLLAFGAAAFIYGVNRIPTSPTPAPSTSPSMSTPPLFRGPSQTATEKSPPPTPTNFVDDFSSNSLDANRWEPTLDSDSIFVEDQALRVRVTPGQSADSVSGSLMPITGTQPIKEVAFTMTLLSYSGNIAGAANVDVSHVGGRNHTVGMGPSPKGYPEIEYDLCLKEQCSGEYDDYSHKSIRIGLNQPVRMRIVWTGERAQFFIGEELKVEGPPDTTPIIQVEFGFYADPGSVYQVKVDDVTIIHV